MKRISVYIISFIIIIFILTTYYYLNHSYQKVDIFTAKGFDKETNTPILFVTDKKTLKKITTIIKTADKINGILDVAAPDYILEIHGFGNSIKTIYLWLEEENINGMIMYINETSTGYSISEVNTQKLKEVILSLKNY
jgi:hypothetical protein